MMKRQGLVVTAWSLSGDCGHTFGFYGLPLIGVVFFLSSSLMGVIVFLSFSLVGVVLFPSYAH